MLNFIEQMKGRGGVKNTFFVQYLSLILIIRVFTIGAFLRGPQPLKTPEDQVEIRNFVKATDLSEVTYNDLFKEATHDLNADIVTALVMLLETHDIDMEILLSPASPSELDYNTTLGRAITLAKYLEGQNIPQDSWRILTAELPLGTQAKVKFIKLNGEKDGAGF